MLTKPTETCRKLQKLQSITQPQNTRCSAINSEDSLLSGSRRTALLIPRLHVHQCPKHRPASFTTQRFLFISQDWRLTQSYANYQNIKLDWQLIQRKGKVCSALRQLLSFKNKHQNKNACSVHKIYAYVYIWKEKDAYIPENLTL